MVNNRGLFPIKVATTMLLAAFVFCEPTRAQTAETTKFYNMHAIEAAKIAIISETGSTLQNRTSLDVAEVRAILYKNSDAKFFDDNLRKLIKVANVELPSQFWFIWFCECKSDIGFKGSSTGVVLESPSRRVVTVVPYL